MKFGAQYFVVVEGEIAHNFSTQVAEAVQRIMNTQVFEVHHMELLIYFELSDVTVSSSENFCDFEDLMQVVFLVPDERKLK